MSQFRKFRSCRSLQNEEIPEQVFNMTIRMIEQLNKRFLNTEENLLIVESTFLDPRFKKHGFTDMKAYGRTKVALSQGASRIALKDTVSPYTTAKNDNTTGNIPEEEGTSQMNTSILSIWDDYDKQPLYFKLTLTQLLPS